MAEEGAMLVGDKKLGKVKWFNSSKSFSLIMPDEGGKDLFVHQTLIHTEGFWSLCEGKAVEFEVESSDDEHTKVLSLTSPRGAFVQGASYRCNKYRRAL